MSKKKKAKPAKKSNAYEKPCAREIKFKNLHKKAGAAAMSGCGCCGCGCGCW